MKHEEDPLIDSVDEALYHTGADVRQRDLSGRVYDAIEEGVCTILLPMLSRTAQTQIGMVTVFTKQQPGDDTVELTLRVLGTHDETWTRTIYVERAAEWRDIR